MPSLLEVLDTLKSSISAQTAEWTRRPIKQLPPPMTINKDVATTMHTLILGEHDEFSVVGAYNHDDGGIDLVAFYSVDEEDNVPLIGARFGAWLRDGVTPARIPETLANVLAPELVAAFAQAVGPHLEFLHLVRVAELTMPDGLKHVTDQIDQGKITGVFNLPSDLGGGA